MDRSICLVEQSASIKPPRTSTTNNKYPSSVSLMDGQYPPSILDLLQWWARFTRRIEAFTSSIRSDRKLAAFLNVFSRLEGTPYHTWSSTLSWIGAELPWSSDSDSDRRTILAAIEALSEPEIIPNPEREIVQDDMLRTHLHRHLSAIKAKRRLDNRVYETLRTSIPATIGLLERYIKTRGQLDNLLPYAVILVGRAYKHTRPQIESPEIPTFAALVSQVHFLNVVLSSLDAPSNSHIGYIALNMSINSEEDIHKCLRWSASRRDELTGNIVPTFKKIVDNPDIGKYDKDIARALYVLSGIEIAGQSDAYLTDEEEAM